MRSWMPRYDQITCLFRNAENFPNWCCRPHSTSGMPRPRRCSEDQLSAERLSKLVSICAYEHE